MSAPVYRPAGVTAAAVVALIGSLLAFLAAVMMFTTAFVELPPPQPPDYPALAIGSGLFIGALAALGIATSIALFRMRRWARTSIVAFATVLGIVGLFGLVVAAFVPTTPVPNADPAVTAAIRPVIIGVFAIPLIVSAWWLVLFNLKSTRDAFAAVSPDADLELPLSISLTAWVSIVGGVACVIPILMRLPAILFGVTLNGWAAGVVYAFFGALSIWIGRGLLDLRERARVACIAWYLLSVLHTALVTFVPSLRAKMLAAQRAIAAGQGAPPIDPSAMTYLTLLLIAIVAVLAIAFLHKHRALFRHGPEQSA